MEIGAPAPRKERRLDLKKPLAVQVVAAGGAVATREVLHGAEGGGRVIAVVQPHRYTRLRDLMDEFSTCLSDADAVFVADVYPAGEAPIEGVDKHALVEGARRFGHRNVQALENAAVLPRLIKDEADPGDLVVLLGAGDITSWAYALPAQLEALG